MSKVIDLQQKTSDVMSDDKADAPEIIGDHFCIHTMDEIIASSDDPPPWIIENFLAEQGIGTISGRAKSFKSWLVKDLALAMCMGDDWHGMKTKRGKVVYVNLELSERTLHFRIKKLAKAREIDLAELNGHFLPLTINRNALWRDLASSLDPETASGAYCRGVMDQIVRAVRQVKMKDPQLVILDSFYNLAGGINENDAADVAGIYQTVRGLKDDIGAGVMMVHHFAKGDPGSKMEGERGAGSRVHRQEPNTYAELTPHQEDNAVVFNSDQRDYKPMKKFCLRWEFPVLERDDDLDTEDIKRPPKGGRQPKYGVKDILASLKGQCLTGIEWLEESGVPRTTFYRLKSVAIKTEKVIEKDGYFSVPK